MTGDIAENVVEKVRPWNIHPVSRFEDDGAAKGSVEEASLRAAISKGGGGGGGGGGAGGAGSTTTGNEAVVREAGVRPAAVLCEGINRLEIR